MLIPFSKGWRTKIVSAITFNANQTTTGGFSFRVAHASLSNGGKFVRVKFQAASSGSNFVTNNCAIGIQSATSATVATPVELKFSGVSGFTLAPGATLVSDWAALTIAPGDSVLVITDHAATSAMATLAGAGTEYYKATTASYNVTAPAGFSSEAFQSGSSQIEVR